MSTSNSGILIRKLTGDSIKKSAGNLTTENMRTSPNKQWDINTDIHESAHMYTYSCVYLYIYMFVYIYILCGICVLLCITMYTYTFIYMYISLSLSSFLIWCSYKLYVHHQQWWTWIKKWPQPILRNSKGILARKLEKERPQRIG